MLKGAHKMGLLDMPPHAHKEQKKEGFDSKAFFFKQIKKIINCLFIHLYFASFPILDDIAKHFLHYSRSIGDL